MPGNKPRLDAGTQCNAIHPCLTSRNDAHIAASEGSPSVLRRDLPCSMRRSTPSAMPVSGESPGSRARVRNKLVRRAAAEPVRAAGTRRRSGRGAASMLSAMPSRTRPPYRDPPAVIPLRDVSHLVPIPGNVPSRLRVHTARSAGRGEHTRHPVIQTSRETLRTLRGGRHLTSIGSDRPRFQHAEPSQAALQQMNARSRMRTQFEPCRNADVDRTRPLQSSRTRSPSTTSPP